MEDATLQNLTADGFGYWLAGFVDGEGCFRIHSAPRRQAQPWYACHFQVKLRDDDTAILNECVDRTGIGKVIRMAGHKTSKPQAMWVAWSLADCEEVVELFTRFPLRAKKRLDFEIWIRAVAVIRDTPRGNRWHGPRDWSPLLVIRDELRAVREYS